MHFIQTKQLAFFSLLALLSLPHAFADTGNGKTTGAKEVQFHRGLIAFSIPEHWVEKFASADESTFQESGNNTGKLHVSVITMKLPIMVADNSGAKALCILKDVKPSEVENLPNGNAMAKSVEHKTAQGQPVTLYSWFVAHPIPPYHVRTAIFSYTIHASQEKSPKTAADLRFLEKSIQNTSFNHILD